MPRLPATNSTALFYFNQTRNLHTHEILIKTPDLLLSRESQKCTVLSILQYIFEKGGYNLTRQRIYTAANAKQRRSRPYICPNSFIHMMLSLYADAVKTTSGLIKEKERRQRESEDLVGLGSPCALASRDSRRSDTGYSYPTIWERGMQE